MKKEKIPLLDKLRSDLEIAAASIYSAESLIRYHHGRLPFCRMLRATERHLRKSIAKIDAAKVKAAKQVLKEATRRRA